MLTPRDHLLDPLLPALAGELRNRGLVADVQVLAVCGDPDVRLVACRDDGAVVVELLASPTGDPAPLEWHAVRVLEAQRAVWRGPAREAPASCVAGFLLALLEEPCGPLPYARLG